MTNHEGTPRPTSGELQDGIVAHRRAEIISSVLTSGLRSSRTLTREGVAFLGSATNLDGTSPTLDVISGRTVPPHSYFRSKKDFSSYIQNVLHGENGESILSVIAERPGERLYLVEPEVLGARMRASFLAVVGGNIKWQFIDEYASVYMNVDTIPLDKLTYLIFPDNVYEEYRRFAQGTQEQTSKIKLVPNSVTRRIDIGADPMEFSIPSYEEAIAEVVSELDKPIWIHGVRLPIEDDLRTAA